MSQLVIAKLELKKVKNKEDVYADKKSHFMPI